MRGQCASGPHESIYSLRAKMMCSSGPTGRRRIKSHSHGHQGRRERRLRASLLESDQVEVRTGEHQTCSLISFSPSASQSTTAYMWRPVATYQSG